MRLDNPLYIEVVFNQIAPDYLEGLLLIMPGEQIEQDVVYDISKVAALLHRAADMDQKPSIKETKFLLPKPALSAKDIKPPQWVNMVIIAFLKLMIVRMIVHNLILFEISGSRKLGRSARVIHKSGQGTSFRNSVCLATIWF